MITASPDMTVRAWDTKTGEQVKKMTEHDNFVNSCCPLRRGPPLLVSGSDDTSSKAILLLCNFQSWTAFKGFIALGQAKAFKGKFWKGVY